MVKKQNDNDFVVTKLAVISKTLEYIKEELDEIKEKLDSHYVTRTEFDPIKKIVYGIVGSVLLGVVAALISLVIMR